MPSTGQNTWPSFDPFAGCGPCPHISQRGCPILGRTDADIIPSRLNPKVEGAWVTRDGVEWNSAKHDARESRRRLSNTIRIPHQISPNWLVATCAFRRPRYAAPDGLEQESDICARVRSAVPSTTASERACCVGLTLHAAFHTRRTLAIRMVSSMTAFWYDAMRAPGTTLWRRVKMMPPTALRSWANGWQYHQVPPRAPWGSKIPGSPAGPPISGSR